MISVNPTGGLSAVGIGDSVSPTTATDKEDFLKLLVVQMRYQDPLNPMEGSEFAAQLAQFSSLEELRNIGGKLDSSVEADMLMARAINNTLAATLIGKSVRAIDERVEFDGTNAVAVNFNLSTAAANTRVDILSESGRIVRTINSANLPQGDGSVMWDGRDATGNILPPGNYYVSVSATGFDGEVVQSYPVYVGRIQSVRFENGNPVLVTSGRDISFGSVLEILESGDQSAETESWFQRLLRSTGGA